MILPSSVFFEMNFNRSSFLTSDGSRRKKQMLPPEIHSVLQAHGFSFQALWSACLLPEACELYCPLFKLFIILFSCSHWWHTPLFFIILWLSCMCQVLLYRIRAELSGDVYGDRIRLWSWGICCLALFFFERYFDSSGVEVWNSVKSGIEVAFSTKIWYNVCMALIFQHVCTVMSMCPSIRLKKYVRC